MASALQADMLVFIAEYDRQELWQQDGCRHMGQWLAGHLGITVSEGLRWTTAARALEHLPLIAGALRKGEVSFDKVLQLARFATAETEKDLLGWACKASVNAIRHKADLANRPSLEDTTAVHHERSLWWSFYDDDTRVGIDAMLPAEDGVAVIAAIEALATALPSGPEEDSGFEQRCADALVTLCTTGAGAGRSRPEVVLSAELSQLAGDGAGCALDGGVVLHPELARRIACDCRLRVVLREGGTALGIGDSSRNIPAWLMREVVHRDGGCSFPGCGTKRYLAGHHIVHWIWHGLTELDNLTAVCSFHHKLVHEGGWKVRLEDGIRAVWLRPNGNRYDPGPRPPTTPDPPRKLESLNSS
jgi:DNA polymerase III psi subunit